jgi:seryl-tRNA synthetase
MQKRREATQKRREAMQKRRETMQKRREAMQKRREAMQKRREATQKRREATQKRREAMQKRREATQKRREAMQKRREAMQKRREATQKRREAMHHQVQSYFILHFSFFYMQVIKQLAPAIKFCHPSAKVSSSKRQKNRSFSPHLFALLAHATHWLKLKIGAARVKPFQGNSAYALHNKSYIKHHIFG